MTRDQRKHFASLNAQSATAQEPLKDLNSEEAPKIELYDGETRAWWDSGVAKYRQLHDIPVLLRSQIQKEIQAESLRPIKFTKAGRALDINYGTIIKIPFARPVEYTHPIFAMMDFMGLLEERRLPMLTRQEQINWIMIAGKTGFRKP